MPLSAIDPTAALVVVDLQPVTLGQQTAHPTDEIVERAASLASAFRAHGLPVVLVTVDKAKSGRTDMAPDGMERAFPPEYTAPDPRLGSDPADSRVVKSGWDSFHGSDLDDILRSRGVTQVVLVGMATSIGVESTARGAFERGYHVVVVTDAITDRDADAHDNSVARLFPILAETTTTSAVLDALG